MRIFPICPFLDKCWWRKDRITWRICVKPYYCVCSTGKWIKDQWISLLFKLFIILGLWTTNFHNTNVLIFCNIQCDQQKNIFFVIYLSRSERENLFSLLHRGTANSIFFFFKENMLCVPLSLSVIAFKYKFFKTWRLENEVCSTW